MIIKLQSYLATLKDTERALPPGQRRKVPSITALANEVGMSRVQLQRLASGKVDSIKLDVSSKIIKAMRQRGFQMQVTDLVDYVED